MADTTALHWRADAQRAPQARLQSAVLDSITTDRSIRLAPAERDQLTNWLRTLPVTGRVILGRADVRWLQGTPEADPVLGDGQQVVLYPRPKQVAVVTATAVCLVPHTPGALVHHYLHLCNSALTSEVDAAWIAQPDGRTRRFGIANWNLEAQDEPAPGAWIWAPTRATQIPESLSDNLARFLATQAPFEFLTSNQSVALIHQAQAAMQSVANSATQETTAKPRAAQISASDWGEIGLLQTPTARMAAAGDVRLKISRVAPYTRGTVMLQPLDWLEVGFRYTDISNRLYGSAIAGAQTYKDKSIDVKLRLREESNFWPQVALGLRDFGGTGLFSGEYLVASKRWGNWDASLGLGWGYLGARGNVKNPLSALDATFNTRPVYVAGSTGTPATQTWLYGPAALFGGVQWHTPYDPLTVKLELDGNDYQHEPQANNQPAKSPLNLGLVYAYSPSVDFSLALERGNRWLAGVTLRSAINHLDAAKLLDQPMPRFSPNAAATLPPGGWGNTVQNIEAYTGWTVRSIRHDTASTTVQAETDAALFLQQRIERAVAVLHQDAPASTRRFVFDLQEHGLAMSHLEVDRAEWVAKKVRAEAPAMRLPIFQHGPGLPTVRVVPPDADAAQQNWQAERSSRTLVLEPSYSQSLGGPDGFVLFQLGAQAKLEQRFSDATWLNGVLDYRLIDNYNNFKYTAPSNLPRVRTYVREYVTTSRLTLHSLQLTHVSDLGGGHYLSSYAGLLERMYGGVGAEWLYRPWRGRLAFGVDANMVRQRDFKQDLTFRDYRVNTGHASVYWDTGWNDVQVNVSAGRYLAGDIGASLNISRVFQNGTSIGAWATKTNVSAEQFGEGSFDKGIYVNIPFDVMMPKSSPSTASIIWSPLTRDGGARLARKFGLFDLTKQRDRRALQWRAVKPEGLTSASDTSYVLSEPNPTIFQTIGPSGATLAGQVTDIPASSWAWAGGAVLAASLLDNKVDTWAVNHQTPVWNRIGSIGNNLPVVMGLGTALFYAGMAGPDAADTAETALKAGAYTLGASLVTRYTVGRARPYENLGSHHFDGFNNHAFQSGFTSNHVSLAFALATPFAQKHDMPWLYGLAGLSALGRVQSRDHWLSDTVASAAVGYAIGTLVGQQKRSPKEMQLTVTPQSVRADWRFD
ncbi:MAG: YjbH domain-containing protein [Rhodoferax sp.]|nr:YjbH domain-containing protein [Rhodoferax sp.]